MKKEGKNGWPAHEHEEDSFPPYQTWNALEKKCERVSPLKQYHFKNVTPDRLLFVFYVENNTP
jgi:hypothetical protein